MKLTEGNSSFEDHSGITSTEYSVACSPKLFKIMSSNIYENKIRAIIREYSTNAVDSHVAAGITRPALVHLPTMFEPYFSIRDYGKSLKPDEMHLFASFFASDKTASNDFVGCLGLGSCAAFSLVKQFRVTTYIDGILREYLCFENERGIPSLMEVYTEDTLEANGLKVHIDLPEITAKFEQFKEEAVEVYRWFKPENVPQLNIGNDWLQSQINDRNSVEVQLTDKTAILSSGHSYCVMGGVAYKTPNKFLLKHSPVVMHFELGELEFDPGRENLSLDDRTLANLEARYKEMCDIIYDKVYAQVMQHKNKHIRGIEFRKVDYSYRTASSYVQERINKELKPELIDSSVPCFAISPEGRVKHNNLMVSNTTKVVLYEKGCLAGLKLWCVENKATALVVKVEHLEDTENLEAGSTYVIPRTKAARAKAKIQTAKIPASARIMTSGGKISSTSYTVDTSKEYVYVPLEDLTKTHKQIHRLASVLVKSMPYVYVTAKKFPHTKNGITLIDYARKNVTIPEKIVCEEPQYSHVLKCIDDRFDISYTSNCHKKELARLLGIKVEEDKSLHDLREKYLERYPIISMLTVWSSEQRRIVKKSFERIEG